MSLQQLTSTLTQAQLDELRMIGFNLEKSAKKKREKYQHPQQSDLTKVIRVGSNYIFGGIRVSHTEIDVIESQDFPQKVEVVRKITTLIRDKEFEANKRIWSILETCVVICVIYDHSIRNEIMKELTLNHLNFYSELCKTFKLQRKFEAYSRKLRDVKDLKLTLDDLKKIHQYLESHIDDLATLNKNKIVKINNKLLIEPLFQDFAVIKKRASELGQPELPTEQKTEQEEQKNEPMEDLNHSNLSSELNFPNVKTELTQQMVKTENRNIIQTAPEILDQREDLEEAMLREIKEIIPMIQMDELKRLYRLYDNNMERLIQELINIYSKQLSSEESSTEAIQ